MIFALTQDLFHLESDLAIDHKRSLIDCQSIQAMRKKFVVPETPKGIPAAITST
jgi:hypothetical protein